MSAKLFIPPLAPLLLLVGISVWVLITPGEMIEGRPDNVPSMAAGMFLWLSPVYFLLCFFLNAIDQCFDSETGGIGPWLWTLLFCAVVASLLAWRGGSELHLIVIAVGGTILPMSVVRRWIVRRKGSLAQSFFEALGDL